MKCHLFEKIAKTVELSFNGLTSLNSFSQFQAKKFPDFSQLRIYRPLPPPLRSGYLCIKDGKCAEESNEKSSIRFFRFLVFRSQNFLGTTNVLNIHEQNKSKK